MKNSAKLNTTAKKWITQHCGRYALFDEPMALHTTFSVGGPAEVYIEPPTLDNLKTILSWLIQNNLPYWVIGTGSNLLVKDNGVQGVVISLKRCYQCSIELLKRRKYAILNVASGVRLQTLCQFAIKHGLRGLNFALGIPGTVGGGIMMNAGANGKSMGDVLESVTVQFPREGRIGRVPVQIQKMKIPKSQLKTDYRHFSVFNVQCSTRPVIIESCLRLHYDKPSRLKKEAMEILKIRRLNQPVKSLSAGCFFKNPTGAHKNAVGTAGKLIDLAGLKGKRIGDALVSHRHANFIINTHTASASDILALKNLIQESVFKRFGVTLEPEVEIIG
ncbi:UDP-N-acetylmuramate dehydrogenase [Desulfococcaceae bacterium HSG7]|nr:UDP-N-acetylmuramate dehydrogenase [Desulfococcaceae bacterium HSG7]